MIDFRMPVVPITAGSSSCYRLSTGPYSLRDSRSYLLDVRHVEVKRASGVDDSLEWRIGDDRLVESSLLRDIFYNGEIQLVFADVRVCFLDLVCLFLAADSGDYGVAAREKLLEFRR